MGYLIPQSWTADECRRTAGYLRLIMQNALGKHPGQSQEISARAIELGIWDTVGRLEAANEEMSEVALARNHPAYYERSRNVQGTP